MTQVILCSGIKRSASTWSFNVCRELGAHIARTTKGKLISGYDDDTDSLIRKLSEKDARDGTETVAVIKSHLPGVKTQEWARQGKIRNISTIRDPRDCFASLEGFWPQEDGKSIESRIRDFRPWLEYAESFSDDGCSLLVRFEDMTADPLGQIRRINDYLEMDRDEELLEKISISTSVAASQAIIDKMTRNKTDGVRVYHRKTQLHENHLNGGKIGRWRADLTPEVQDKVHTAFLPWLTKFGYVDQQ